jgi:threonylcarbamoyladenosine tRNA methylthiotransferase MtaB
MIALRLTLMSDSERPRTAALLTLGCKLNIADSEAMARRLRRAGWNVVDRATDADAVIVNSCSVTHVADQKSRHLVRTARRVAPKATVALTGCLLETAPAPKIEALGADLVYRQPDQHALAERIIELYPSKHGHGDALGETRESRPAGLKTRAFISAQEGCNDVCAFCIIPRTRGRERSKPVAEVVAEARAREAEGVQEIVITGTQLGAYGRDWGHRTPYPLLKGLLDGTSIPRIRMSSLQPQDLSDEVIGLWQDERLCRHFHLALQSGSASVLQRMRRRYTQDEYRDAARRLRQAVPDVAITTDVIGGFPGETDAEFEESYEFCREMAFAGIHVFPYSNREGTLAARLPAHIPDHNKKARVHRLIWLADRMARDYRSRFLGTLTNVLWESKREDCLWEGLTDTYIRVRAPSSADLTNRLAPVRLIGLSADGINGEVIA